MELNIKKGLTNVLLAQIQDKVIRSASPESPSLDKMVASFDPACHGGEVMVARPIGAEVLQKL